MKLAIMQPYFLPYIGYFQLIAAADVFVVYDNIKYTKKGWINRNRFLLNGADAMFSLPLKKDSDFLDIRDRELAEDFRRDKLLNQLQGAYRRAPHFPQTESLLREIVLHEDRNLFGFIHNSIVRICRHIGIETKILVSSTVSIDHSLRSQDKVIALCKKLAANTYINPIGGTDLYSKDDFRSRDVELQFVRSKPFEYLQFGEAFVPWLSILDVLMFNPLDRVREGVYNNFELI